MALCHMQAKKTSKLINILWWNQQAGKNEKNKSLKNINEWKKWFFKKSLNGPIHFEINVCI